MRSKSSKLSNNPAIGSNSLYSLSRAGNDQSTNYLGVFNANGEWLAKATGRRDDAVVFIELPKSDIGWTECVDIFVTDDGVFLGTKEFHTQFNPRGMSAVSFSHIQVIPHDLSESDLVRFFRKGFLPK